MKMNKNKNQENLFMKILRIILIILLFPVVVTYVVIKKIKKHKKDKQNREKINVYNISQLDFLSGIEFENYLKSLFENMGYAVELTKATGDYGADLIITKKGKSTVVQAKCYNHTVGVKAVQEVISARHHYKIKNAMVVTNNYFSREAENLAVESGVTLTDRVVLEKMIRKYDVKIEKNSTKFSSLTELAKNEMRQKYKFWI